MNRMLVRRSLVDSRGEGWYLCTCSRTPRPGEGVLCPACGYWTSQPPPAELNRRLRAGESSYQERDETRWWETIRIVATPSFRVECENCGVLAIELSEKEANLLRSTHRCVGTGMKVNNGE